MRTDQAGSLSHGFPDTKCNSIHVEQPYLLSVFATLAVDTDRGQKPRLPRFDQVWSLADRGSILGVLHFLRALGHDLIIR